MEELGWKSKDDGRVRMDKDLGWIKSQNGYELGWKSQDGRVRMEKELGWKSKDGERARMEE